MHTDTIVQVGTGTYLVHGSSTNWIVISEGGEATLVDTGYPGDHDQVLWSLAELGQRPADVRAVLITHAHVDHIGAADRLAQDHGVPVLMHEAEVPHARREFLHQVAVGEVLRNAWRPGVLPWLVHAVRAGGTKKGIRVTDPHPFPTAGRLDLPGRPLPVHTPGHTGGHCAYHLPEAGVVITGDGLVTGHPTSPVPGPQLLPQMFDTDRERALASLDVLEGVEADIVLPGHGPVHHGEAGAAARRARELARR